MSKNELTFNFPGATASPLECAQKVLDLKSILIDDSVALRPKTLPRKQAVVGLLHETFGAPVAMTLHGKGEMLMAKLLRVLSPLFLLFSTGCVVVGGYSSGRGWFIWPGTFGLLIIGVILFLLFRRRA